MEDLKKIQEFFSKPLEEGKQLDIEDFAKVVQAVTKTGHPVTVLFTPKFNEIEVLTGMNAPDDMLRDLSIAVDSLGYGRNDIIIAGDSSNLSRREYSDIRRVNGGHKDYFEESLEEKAMSKFADYSNNELAAYARELSKQRADAASKGQSDLLGGINKEIEAATRELKKRSQALKGLTRTDEAQEEDVIDTITMDVPLFIRVLEYAREDAQADMDLHDLAEKAIAATKQQGLLQMDDYDMLVGEKESVDEEVKGVPVEKTPSTITRKEWNKTPKNAKAMINGIAYVQRYDRVIGTYMAPIKIVGEIEETELTEAYVPSNIAEFAKRRGISSLVRKVAGWAEKVGARITGGTAIGKGYNTLILDLGYQTADIRIDVEDETIELYDEPVYSFADFKNVFMEEVSRQQAEHDEEQLRREQGLEEEEKGYSKYLVSKENPKGETKGLTPDVLSKILKNVVKDVEETIKLGQQLDESTLCKRGQDYIKARKAAGEKSSAYLSGRAVKVCKGDIKFKGKKQKDFKG